MVAGETVRVIERLHPAAEITLGAASARFPFRRKAITAADLEIAGRILALPEETPAAELRQRAGLGREGPFSWVIGQPIPGNVLRQYAQECQLLAKLPERMETEIQALRIGNGTVVGLPGEIFVELGLALKGNQSEVRGPAQGSQPGPLPRHRFEGLGLGSPEGPKPEAVLIASLANDYVGYVGTRRAIAEEGSYETWAARSSLPAAGEGERMVEVATGLLAQLFADGTEAP
jgi:hypothetical protein